MWKLYVTDNNGRVVFDFSGESGGHSLAARTEEQVKISVLLQAALKFLEINGGVKKEMP